PELAPRPRPREDAVQPRYERPRALPGPELPSRQPRKKIALPGRKSPRSDVIWCIVVIAVFAVCGIGIIAAVRQAPNQPPAPPIVVAPDIDRGMMPNRVPVNPNLDVLQPGQAEAEIRVLFTVLGASLRDGDHDGAVINFD